MARATDKRINDAWKDFESFRAQEESFGAIRELGAILMLSERLPPIQRATWRRQLATIGLTPEEAKYITIRAGKYIRNATALMASANVLLDEEINLLLSTIMELRLVDKFLEFNSDFRISREIDSLQSELGSLRESPQLRSKFQREEANIYKNSGLRLSDD